MDRHKGFVRSTLVRKAESWPGLHSSKIKHGNISQGSNKGIMKASLITKNLMRISESKNLK